MCQVQARDLKCHQVQRCLQEFIQIQEQDTEDSKDTSESREDGQVLEAQDTNSRIKTEVGEEQVLSFHHEVTFLEKETG